MAQHVSVSGRAADFDLRKNKYMNREALCSYVTPCELNFQAYNPECENYEKTSEPGSYTILVSALHQRALILRVYFA